MASVDFWYEFASTYSYLAAERIETVAAEAGVTVRWRPFLLGPIFAAQGWTSSPFNLYPAKGANMWRDLERIAAGMGLPFGRPDPFPQNGLLAARLALIGADEGWIAPFSRAVFRLEFAAGRDISDQDELVEVLAALGLDGVALVDRANADKDVKARLRAETEAAAAAGLYGAPSFVTEDGELFWGNDRLEQAIDWARNGRLTTSVAAPETRP
ncbi:2-hydroxychromene-2-carboxylate isomerase [Methyloraptor flagellatus]|uniref:2-hydroxychromene-2-carboxylate isomerase n=1 Tax=Methyloraptor flagellatus TaxID=3162530 RepID=A0AAU7XA13_9HYPH